MPMASADHPGGDHEDNPNIQSPRHVVRKIFAEPRKHGDGATVRRSIGTPEMMDLDPFLLLDEFSIPHTGGMPDHPHRGFETLTYMFEGALGHQDFFGNRGIIRAGDVQWMTAGRGIVHSAMPASAGSQTGLQLWVNLPSKDKMIEPTYHEVRRNDIKRVAVPGADIRIVAGEAFGFRSPAYTKTPILCLDVEMKPGAHLRQPIPAAWNSFVYLAAGEGIFGGEKCSPVSGHHALVLGEGDGLSVWNESGEPLRFFLFAGKPLEETVARNRFFVMNSEEEIEKASEDYRTWKNGYENARDWKSETQITTYD
ncbi:Pirin-like protein [Apostasia shenzhenica]|uniref:Pirin-like protein n=1 Tax=Apostasia shenzhenica TaxID=1088818 RepID=A0A2I0B0G6_9ASPA|nr:Pirin-like protein [Apostasia shenzhenica]